jgi:very-short-patch-repair endonuclease
VLERKKPLQRRSGLNPGTKGLKRSGFKTTGFKSASTKTRAADTAESDTPPVDALKLDAERKLWSLLQNHAIRGLRFQRRQLVGPYLVDFLCPDAKLLLEVSPGQDSADDHERRDAIRALGYRILKLDAQSVLDNPQAALDGLSASFVLRVISRDA